MTERLARGSSRRPWRVVAIWVIAVIAAVPATPAAGSQKRDRPTGGDMSHDARSEHERLGALVGRWKTEGWTKEADGAAPRRIDAVDTYEWLPGRFALLHRVDAQVGDQKVEGAEIIGYDPARGSYVTQYFGSDGPAAYEAKLSEEDGTLLWAMRSESDRFTGTF